MTITEFDCLDVYYNWWKNGFKGRLVICRECGDLVHVKSKHDGSTKYCEDCAKKIKLAQTRESKGRAK